MEKKEMLYEGKAKQLFATEVTDQLIVHFKDDATAFNGQKKGQIKEKGKINNKITNFFFKLLEAEGIKTHLIRELNQTDSLVKKVKIIPLEVVMRNLAAGSLAKRIGFTEGKLLRQPVIEFYYKDDQLGDPLINISHIELLKLAEHQELEKLIALSHKINYILSKFLKARKIDLVDFKLEFGKTASGEIILADEITPDTCRFWDSQTKEKLDKDRFRRDLGNVEAAYQEMYQRITGQKWQ
ncbi:phosphoribosylaminoimidazolesuccinocarboxamide synthase [Halanaerobium praevalens]|uniref:Phosphoribosylaminoimidazole-succinocarboxamide synthase n=1 Tax=Halanaerobium praevalens (strain ATCC 33744 / DSM 2228 / GSL) TaxID=572479 RepID=E3DMB9_HALPG|nr:phosphoribosylaminoimidazolesuccinocarboxamide synthase [Halanaerobium praevalens]ADO76312.1 phosphoribosylaminoimidazole-succinocarboxamide synthase [Halanaerobium praevalens DSM 2228]